jgi:hypothetical protein
MVDATELSQPDILAGSVLGFNVIATPTVAKSSCRAGEFDMDQPGLAVAGHGSPLAIHPALERFDNSR